MSDHKEITIYHSPDADDAFMFYGLTSGAIDIPGYTFKHELCDIESLNNRTIAGELDVTAVSVHAYAYLKDQYAITSCGASMGGKDYGPRLVSKAPLKLSDGKKVALPGKFTSATLAMQIYAREHELNLDFIQCDFDSIVELVQSGEVDAGLLIHEGQITHEREGLHCIVDLGEWWWEKGNLPLPLGVNVVKRALGDKTMQAAASALRQSIEYSLEHREKALEYALSYGRGISQDEADKFVGWYVNERTLDIGEDGRKSIQEFLRLGTEYGFIPHHVDVQFVS